MILNYKYPNEKLLKKTKFLFIYLIYFKTNIVEKIVITFILNQQLKVLKINNKNIIRILFIHNK